MYFSSFVEHLIEGKKVLFLFGFILDVKIGNANLTFFSKRWA